MQGARGIHPVRVGDAVNQRHITGEEGWCCYQLHMYAGCKRNPSSQGDAVNQRHITGEEGWCCYQLHMYARCKRNPSSQGDAGSHIAGVESSDGQWAETSENSSSDRTMVHVIKFQHAYISV